MKTVGIGLLVRVNVPGQCVDKQAAPPKMVGYSHKAYIEIKPPIELPATKVCDWSLDTENEESIIGFTVSTKYFR